MVESIARITLDVQDLSTSVTVSAKHGDTGRKIVIALSDGGFLYEIGPDCYAVLTAEKPDGSILFNHCDIEGNCIVYAFTEQTTAVVGVFPCEVKLYGADDALITAARFRMIVDGTIYRDNLVESKDEVSALTHLLSEATEVINTGNKLNEQGQLAIQEVQTATQEAILATEQAEQSATDADEAAESASAAAVAAELATERTNQAVQETQTATQEAINAASAANSAADRAQDALVTVEQAAKTAAEMAEDAEQAVKDAEIAIESAEKATTAANAAADRANAASTVAYQANEKVDTLREVVSKLHSNIVETASGEVITVSDASDLELAGLRIFGKTEQRTTTGKNLLKNTAASNPGLHGIAFTVNADGSIKISGTATANASIKIGDITYEPGKTYIVSGNSGASSTTFALWSGGVGTIYNTDKTFTATEETKTELSVTVFKGANVNTTIRPMIRLASITDGTYEPYTGGKPSPSPEYPQELESVGDGGSVTVTVCGKNLLNLKDYYVPNSNGLNITISDGVIVLNGTANAIVDITVVSRNINRDTFVAVNNLSGETVCVSNNLGLTGYFYDGTNYADNKTTVPASGINSVLVRIPSGSSYNNTKLYIQIEKGSLATAYEPYTGTTATVTPVDTSGNALYLPGIPVTSGGNYTDPVTKQQWICDEVDVEKGVYVQRVGKIQLTSAMTWKINAANTRIYTVLDNVVTALASPILCSHAKNGTWTNKVSGTVCIGTGTASACGFSVEDFATIDELTTWLNAQTDGVYVIVPLATAIETALSAEELAAFATMQSHYPNTTVFNDAGAHMEVSYIADTQKYVDKKFEALEAAIANLI